MERLTLTAEAGDMNTRIDSIISVRGNMSRTAAKRLIDMDLVLVNNICVKARYRVRIGDKIHITIPDREPEDHLIPEDIPIDILWEDEHIIIVNKPPHMVVYPAAGHRSGTLMNAIAAHCGHLPSIGAPVRPGVVHRLDKDTSGAIVIAKDDASYYDLVNQFRTREIEKQYCALLYGRLRHRTGEIRAPIGRSASDRKKMSTRTRAGKEAHTCFDVVNVFPSATLARITILTGRTHQIRVHFASISHPVLGDITYGKKTSIRQGQKVIVFKRQMLHAQSLELRHPATGEMLRVTAPLPDDMQHAIDELAE